MVVDSLPHAGFAQDFGADGSGPSARLPGRTARRGASGAIGASEERPGNRRLLLGAGQEEADLHAMEGLPRHDLEFMCAGEGQAGQCWGTGEVVREAGEAG